MPLLHDNGFTMVRLPVDPTPYLVFKGKALDTVYDILFDAIRFIQSQQLRVVVDLHPTSSHPVWGATVLLRTNNSEYLRSARFV